MQSSSTQTCNFLPSELLIDTFFILQVSSLHGVHNPILPHIDWSAMPLFPMWVPFCNLSSNFAGLHSHDMAIPS